MATFVKGDSVQVTPSVDWKWDQWSYDHTDLCDKVCTVTDVRFEQWINQLYVEVDYRGKRVWFKDHHLIKVDDYEEVFQESIHRACEELQKHEKICKKLRDEILDGVFGDGEPRQEEEQDDDIFDDWQDVTTKEVIPLPGNGGTMTTPTDPKASADSNRKKVRKMKSLGKRIKKTKQTASGSLSGSWSLTEEELQDLQDYIDSLPDSITTTSDMDYSYNWDDDWDWGGDAD